jgi:hypothetical protein
MKTGKSVNIKTLAFSVFVLLSCTFPNYACLCDGTPTVPEEFNHATAIFAGVYLGEEYRKGIKNQYREMERSEGKDVAYEVLVQRFRVETFWKGDLSSEVVIVTDRTRASDGTESISDCGLGFEVGKRYLVYAFGEEKELGSSACTRTRRWSRAKDDLRYLGKGTKVRVDK